MSKPLCGKTRKTDKKWKDKDLACFPGPWRRWCDDCLNTLEKRDDLPDDPEAITDEIVKRTGNGSESGTGNTLHIPKAAVPDEEVLAEA